MSADHHSHVVDAPGSISEQKAHSIDIDADASSSNSQGRPPKYGNEKDIEKSDYPELAQQTTLHEGEAKYNRLGWFKLTICLIVEAIALGSLSIPSAFATLGMVGGILISLGLGCIAIYTGLVIGQVKLKHPHISHYADAVQLIWGKTGYIVCSIMFTLFLTLLLGSHALTGTIAFVDIIQKRDVCAVVFGVVSAILLFVLALPPSFAEFAILGYIDFASILLAIGITIIATGVRAGQQEGGFSAVPWSAWPPPGTTLAQGFLASTNIIFAYSFSVTQFSFMEEMHTPKDYVKSIWALGIADMFIYTFLGAIIYAFTGNDVKSPALLSGGETISRIAFGVALPVIFISGSINGTVLGRYIMNIGFKDSIIRYVNTPRAWVIWSSLIATITLVAFVIAEAIPFFNALLGLISSLFMSGFMFYWPALFWFQITHEGKWYRGWKNILAAIVNVVILIIGLLVLGIGTYASVEDIINSYASGSVHGSFTCDQSAYVK